MCVIDIDTCNCGCHYSNAVHHIMPCCHTCAVCGAHVRSLGRHMGEHERIQKLIAEAMSDERPS